MPFPSVASRPSVTSLRPAGVTVPVIRPEGFAGAVSKGKVVVEFFSPACGFCRAADPEVHKVANAMSEQVRFVKVNLLDPAGMALGKKFGLHNFPTFAVFQDGAYLGTFDRQEDQQVTQAFIAENVNALLG